MFAALDALDGVPPQAMVCMPAHTSKDAIGVAFLGNGSRLSKIDRDSNNEADGLAKAAVAAHRVPKVIRKQLKQHDDLTEATARWVARATHLTGHQEAPPFRDTEASRQLAAVAAKQRAGQRHAGGQPRRAAVSVCPAALGGHSIRRDAGLWVCTCCPKKSKSFHKLAPKRCDGSAAAMWAMKTRAMDSRGVAQGGGHQRMLIGELLWCMTSGAYAVTAARWLAKHCPGPFHGKWKGGGKPSQLKRLMCWHPVALAQLPQPILELCWHTLQCADNALASGSQLAPCCPTRPRHEGSLRMAAMIERVRAKEAMAKAEARPTQKKPMQALPAKRCIDSLATPMAVQEPGGIKDEGQRCSKLLRALDETSFPSPPLIPRIGGGLEKSPNPGTFVEVDKVAKMYGGIEGQVLGLDPGEVHKYGRGSMARAEQPCRQVASSRPPVAGAYSHSSDASPPADPDPSEVRRAALMERAQASERMNALDAKGTSAGARKLLRVRTRDPFSPG